MGKKSRRKGKRGERLAAHALNEALGIITAHRGAQHKGGADSPDVAGVPGLHVEVKYNTGLKSLFSWMRQADEDAGEEAIPVVMHKGSGRDVNRDGWLCVVRLADLRALAQALAEEV